MNIQLRLTAIVLALQVSYAYSADELLTIDVEINGATPAVGQVLVSLFDSPDNYLQIPLNEAVAKVGPNGNASVTFDNCKSGEYAIVVIYDKNENGKLDTGLFRIPKEKIGYSNNATGRFGPAKWANVRFLLSESNIRKRIQLKKAKQSK